MNQKIKKTITKNFSITEDNDFLMIHQTVSAWKIINNNRSMIIWESKFDRKTNSVNNVSSILEI